MNNFTKGPWVIEPHKEDTRQVQIIGKRKDNPDALFGQHVITMLAHHKEAMANAMLIASAPELLEALKEIIKVSRLQCKNPKCTCVQCHLVNNAKSAIAKAEGKKSEMAHANETEDYN